MVSNDGKCLQIIIKHYHVCFWENSKKSFSKFSKISDFSGQRVMFEGPYLFIPIVSNLEIFTLRRAAQELHFKPFKSFWAYCVHMFTVKKLLQRRKTAPLSGQNEISIVFCWSPRPIPQLQNHIWEVLSPSQISIFRHFHPYGYHTCWKR